MVSRINHLTNATGAERRQQLVLVAYRLIAEKGFEGLRTRDVADQVGINHATLHYHFPTKEDLIKGVVDYLIQKFSSPHMGSATGDRSAMELVRGEFAEVRQFHKEPGMLVVLEELSLRALRDQTIAKLLDDMEKGWRSYLIETLQRGVQQGAFRPDLDVDLAASVIMTVIKGIRADAMTKSQHRIARITAALQMHMERWLVGDK